MISLGKEKYPASSWGFSVKVNWGLPNSWIETCGLHSFCFALVLGKSFQNFIKISQCYSLARVLIPFPLLLLNIKWYMMDWPTRFTLPHRSNFFHLKLLYVKTYPVHSSHTAAGRHMDVTRTRSENDLRRNSSSQKPSIKDFRIPTWCFWLPVLAAEMYSTHRLFAHDRLFLNLASSIVPQTERQ